MVGREATLVIHHLGYIGREATLDIHHLVYIGGVYTPGYTPLLYTPGYTLPCYTTCPGMSAYSVSWLCSAVRALGSTLRLITEKRLPGASGPKSVNS